MRAISARRLSCEGKFMRGTRRHSPQPQNNEPGQAIRCLDAACCTAFAVAHHTNEEAHITSQTRTDYTHSIDMETNSLVAHRFVAKRCTSMKNRSATPKIVSSTAHKQRLSETKIWHSKAISNHLHPKMQGTDQSC